eukprot:4625529-Alexandrium_andersonii.AAC.1
MPGADAGTPEAVELQMGPFLPFGNRNDERRRARCRVGAPTYDALFVFDSDEALDAGTARKNVSGAPTPRGVLPFQRLRQVHLRRSADGWGPRDELHRHGARFPTGPRTRG